MKTFNSILKMNLKREFQYRTAALSGAITQLFFGFMYIALYREFLVGDGGDFSVAQMASYIWLGQIFFALFKYFDVCKFEISEKIVNGDVGYQLIRPMNLYSYWYSTVFSKAVGQMLIRGIPLTLLVFILPSGWCLMPPVSMEAFLLFLFSVTVGAFLVAAINMISYIIVLYTLSPSGVFSFIVAIAMFLAGSVIPIPMMPEGVQAVLNFFPFRYVSDLPYRIYIGNISGTEMFIQLGVQLAWLVGLVVIGKLVMNKKMKKLVVQGG